jgi:hypothetical protein
MLGTYVTADEEQETDYLSFIVEVGNELLYVVRNSSLHSIARR